MTEMNTAPQDGGTDDDLRRHTEQATEGGEAATEDGQPREHTQDPAEG